MNRVVRGVSAEAIAAGRVVAARRYDVEPLEVFAPRSGGATRCRVCVGAALRSLIWPRFSRRGGTIDALARLVSIDPKRLAPSMMRNVSHDDQVAVIQAMTGAGLEATAISVVDPDEVADASTLSTPDAKEAIAATSRLLGKRLHRPEGLTPFDPAVLAPRRKAVAPEPAPRRQRDVDPAAKPFDLGPQDAALVRECLRQGGFPQVYEFEAGGETKVFWITPKGENWKHRK